jgi:hypothetical protein
MKLVLSQYLRTLRERDEFDRLLPELVFEMGYVSLAKPQAGPRQFGVDFAAVGKSRVDGVDEILLFVLKQGDIGRSDWSGNSNAVRESLEEVLDVYLSTHIPAQYLSFRKVIVVSTTGDLKQEVQLNWKGFISNHADRAAFDFWSGDKVAELLEMHLLDEHLFDSVDRSDLRKSLALAADSDYRFPDLCRLFLRQLGLSMSGALTEAGQQQTTKALQKAFRRVHLAANVCAYWADADGERRQSLWVCERAILWAWHRLQLHENENQRALYDDVAAIWTSYQKVANRYYETMLDHVNIRDGLSGYCRESGEFSVVLFEHIGLLASIGLTQALAHTAEDVKAVTAQNAEAVVHALGALIQNHGASGSPRLDGHAIDVSLALLLFVLTGQSERAAAWLEELALRLDFTLKMGRLFPVGSDSLDDLVEFDVNGDEDFRDAQMSTSWMFATVAAWCALLHVDQSYERLTKSLVDDYPQVGAQLWHPTIDWPKRWYFGPAHIENGESEAPFNLPPLPGDLRRRTVDFLNIERFQWAEHSPTRPVGIWALDFLACRHFRTPVPAAFWYRIAKARDDAVLRSPALP